MKSSKVKAAIYSLRRLTVTAPSKRELFFVAWPAMRVCPRHMHRPSNQASLLEAGGLRAADDGRSLSQPIRHQRYHSALRVPRPSLRKATSGIHQAASNGGWAPPPRGGGSAAPLQCALKVVGYGGPGPPLPDAEIGGPGRLLRTFRRDEKYARPIKRQDEKSSRPMDSLT